MSMTLPPSKPDSHEPSLSQSTPKPSTPVRPEGKWEMSHSVRRLGKQLASKIKDLVGKATEGVASTTRSIRATLAKSSEKSLDQTIQSVSFLASGKQSDAFEKVVDEMLRTHGDVFELKAVDVSEMVGRNAFNYKIYPNHKNKSFMIAYRLPDEAQTIVFTEVKLHQPIPTPQGQKRLTTAEDVFAYAEQHQTARMGFKTLFSEISNEYKTTRRIEGVLGHLNPADMSKEPLGKWWVYPNDKTGTLDVMIVVDESHRDPEQRCAVMSLDTSNTDPVDFTNPQEPQLVDRETFMKAIEAKTAPFRKEAMETANKRLNNVSTASAALKQCVPDDLKADSEEDARVKLGRGKPGQYCLAPFPGDPTKLGLYIVNEQKEVVKTVIVQNMLKDKRWGTVNETLLNSFRNTLLGWF